MCKVENKERRISGERIMSIPVFFLGVEREFPRSEPGHQPHHPHSPYTSAPELYMYRPGSISYNLKFCTKKLCFMIVEPYVVIEIIAISLCRAPCHERKNLYNALKANVMHVVLFFFFSFPFNGKEKIIKSYITPMY